MRLDQLPTEIVVLVCKKVSKFDVPNLRLTSKFLCSVATPFLLNEIHLVFKPESFHRLLEISQHPVISGSVTSLLYEIDCLERFDSRCEWEQRVIEPSYLSLLQTLPTRCASEEEKFEARQRELEHDRNRRPARANEQYAEDTLAKGWDSYLALYAEQAVLRGSDYGSGAICSAMRALPNLRTIILSHGSGIVERTKQLDKTFSASLQRLYPETSGIPQAQSLLVGAAGAGLSLESVQIGDVDWKILQCDDEDFFKIKDALQSLRTCKLRISTGNDWSIENLGVEIPTCSEFLRQSRRLFHLIKDMPLLNDLTIAFDWFDPTGPAQLEWIVGSITWSFLTVVSFECIDTDDHSWVSFFRRHRGSLRKVCLESIRLLTGKWSAVLEEMHEALTLESACVTGSLLGDDPVQSWYLNPGFPLSSPEDYACQSNRTRKAVEDYLIGWGDCPLLDEEEHPQDR
ncbi:MAG: hypothetical protein Q9182_001638 [Xanthomendoza sp. 2 TL-2023]